MPEFSRRHLLVAGAAVGAASLAGAAPALLRGRSGERVLVVGGGPAGAAAAIALRGAQPATKVLLVERDPTQLRPGRPAGPVSGPLAGAGYDALAAAGVSIAVDEIRDIDWQRGTAAAISGRSFAFDRIVVAPGVAARDEGIEGYDRDAAEAMPHGWFGTT
ncbi:MAG TPA: FAD-dependent oxidoreductase, partial [Hyphomicrobiales bacterium]|nr:FAD-dependent oxidoreductase [Hyphomicrobiales bacterium]